MYRIGNTNFKIENLSSITCPEHFKLFYIDDNNDVDYTYTISHDETFTANCRNQIYKKDGFLVFQNEDNLETRVLSVPNTDLPYAIYEENDKMSARINIHPAFLDSLSLDTLFHSLFAWEKRMMANNAYILHSSYLLVNNKAILFTAPSGTGKSTQADLWVNHRGGRVINGDRTLISKEGDKFYANGWPICGSSEICNNESYEIAAIIYLSQAKENTITPITGMAGVKKLLSEITINYFNRKFVDSSFDFVADMMCSIPFLSLACTPDENAVICLENALKERNLL